MKRILTCVIAFMLAGQAWGFEFTVGSLHYTVTNTTDRIVSVRLANGSVSGDELVIPSTIEEPASGTI